MTNKPNVPPLYETLGLEPGASEEEVRSAYRRMAKRFHPDTNPEDPTSEELFKKVADAYRILSNPAARGRYDRTAGVHRPKSPAQSTEKEVHREPAREVNRDIHVRLHLTIGEAVRGGHRELKIPRKIPCIACEGSGFDSKYQNCSHCNTNGIVRKTTNVEITYPPGVRTGSKLRFATFGHRLPPGNISGDLIVEILLKPDSYIEVKDRDYHYRALIGLDTFIEGGKIVVPTPGVPTAVEIPPRMADGRILKISGKGLPAFSSSQAGDLYLKIELCVPKRLSRKERQLLDELMALPGFRPPVDGDGFIPKGD